MWKITVATITRSGLEQAVQGTDYVYGVVAKDPVTNDGKLGFQKISPFFWELDT